MAPVRLEVLRSAGTAGRGAVPSSRTLRDDQVVNEMVFRFTHSIRLNWMLPGMAPTGKRAEVPLLAIVRLRNSKLAREHFHWEQDLELIQLGLLDASQLPVAGMKVPAKHLILV